MATEHLVVGEKQEIQRLEAAIKYAHQAQARLLEAIEKGRVELDQQLKERIQGNKVRSQAIDLYISKLKRTAQSPLMALTRRKIDAVAKAVAACLQTVMGTWFGVKGAERCDGDRVQTSRDPRHVRPPVVHFEVGAQHLASS